MPNLTINAGPKSFQDRYGQDHHYILYLLPGSKAIRLQTRLAKLLGHLAPLAQGGGFLDLDVQDDRLGKSVQSFLQALDGEDLYKLAQAVFESGTTRDGKVLSNQNSFDEAYRANLLELYRVLVWALEENFGDFIEPLRALLSDAKGTVESTELSGTSRSSQE